MVSKTSADYIEAIRQSGGIITEEDNLTSHAAVIGLRLGIPVIVGVKEATRTIREGSLLTLDVQRGLVYSGTGGPSKRSNRGGFRLPRGSVGNGE